MNVHVQRARSRECAFALRDEDVHVHGHEFERVRERARNRMASKISSDKLETNPLTNQVKYSGGWVKSSEKSSEKTRK